MTSKSMAFRFPAALAQVIESRARATGRDKTHVVVEALTQAFGLPQPSPAPATIEALQEQLSQLEAQIALFSEQLGELRQTADADESLCRLLAAFDRTIAAPTGSDISKSELQTTNPFLEIAMAVASQKLNGKTPEWQPGPATQQLPQQQSEQTLESILAANPDPVCACDRVGRITYINPAGARVWGLERSQFLGKTCQELGLAPNLVAQHVQERETVFTTGRPLNGEISIPTVCEGTRNYEYTLSPIQSASGSVDAVLCTARDITERKQAEIALRESEAKYRNLFESANDGISIVDASTHQILNANWNMARWLGYTRSELLQLSIKDIDAPMAASSTAILHELNLRGYAILEHTYRRKNGTEMSVEVSSRTIEYEGRLAIQSFVRDITERKQAFESLRRSHSILEAQQEATIDGILVVDENRDIVSYNQRFVQMWQIPAEVMQSGEEERLLNYVLSGLKQPKDFLAKVEYLYEHPNELSREEIYLNDGRILDRYSGPVLSPEEDVSFGRIWCFRDITNGRVLSAESAGEE